VTARTAEVSLGLINVANTKTYPEVTVRTFCLRTDGTLPAKTHVTLGEIPKSALKDGRNQMWNDITRGVAALKSVWSFSSTTTADETRMKTDAASGDCLAEAESYIHMGRHHSAAILAGDALEATLHQLCREYRVPLPSKPTVDGMNAQLAQIGVYDSQVEQRLAELQTLWEKANCGLWSEVSKSDVENMLGEIRAFVSQHVAC
jgi:hypothetical protein